jgi:CcmD family protein
LWSAVLFGAVTYDPQKNAGPRYPLRTGRHFFHMADANNKYLFLAYALVWVVFMLYAWNLSRRQSRLKRELEDLAKKLHLKDDHPVPKA